METLDGYQLKSLPIPDLTHVCDLEYFDGPLISHFEQKNGDDYLYYWCDSDDNHNRWMVLRVSETDVLRLANRMVPLDYVIPKRSRDGFVYFADEADDGDIKNVKMVPVRAIPAAYIPSHGVYLHHAVADRNDETYSILIEGDWSAENLGKFPRLFSQVYSVLFSTNILGIKQFDKFPWGRDGYSSMHFFDSIKKQVPVEDRLLISAMQYASPGFMRFSLHAPTAREVTQCVEDLKSNNKKLATAYAKTGTYIRDNGLNDIKEDSPDWKRHNTELQELATNLLEGFSPISEVDFTAACARPFEAAKIASAFYRRIRKLSLFEEKGMVRFPAIQTE